VLAAQASLVPPVLQQAVEELVWSFYIFLLEFPLFGVGEGEAAIGKRSPCRTGFAHKGL
jgi:hypothetical protein